jgi:predicted metal-dependent hydrolase
MRAAVEHSQILFGKTRIAYGICRSTKRKTVALTVAPDEGVVLMAPASVSVERLDRLVHNKARWIVERLKRGVSQASAREFVSGEDFWYLGRQYRLRVRAASVPGHVRLEGRYFHVPVGRGFTSDDRARTARQALVDWYRGHAEPRIRERVARWCRKLGFAVPRVIITSQQRRWASCSAAGIIRINWRIVQAPVALLDYVIAHELAHLRHHGHSRAFWRALGVVMPDYEKRKEALAAAGANFEW